MENLYRVRAAQPIGKQVYVVENEMVFTYLLHHVKRDSYTLLCTSGQLRAAAQKLIGLLIEHGAVIYYSGDLDPDGIGAAHPHIPHHDFTGHAARITVRTRTIGRLHETTLPRQIPLSTILQKRKAFSRQPINIEKGTEPFPLHEDLIRFTAN